MSETLLFVDQAAGDSAEGSLVHVDNQSSEEHLFGANSGNSSNTTEAQKITALQSGNDWYKDDLSHMTTNLMNAEMNTTALTQNHEQNQNLNVGVDNSQVISIAPMNATVNIPAPMGLYNGSLLPISSIYSKMLTDLYHDVLGRAPTQQEINSVDTNKIVYNGKLQPEFDKIVYSQEAYNHIAQMDKEVMGYDVSDAMIKDQQYQLSKYSSVRSDNASISTFSRVSSMADLRRNLAYSNDSYNNINNNANRIFGYDWGNDDNVRWVQGRLAGGESLRGILDSFAYGDETHNSIRDNANRIFGYDWGNDDNVRWVQGRLAGGESLKGILDSFAYGDETYNSIRNNVSRIEGYTWDNYDNIRIQQDRLARGESMQDIINTFAYGDETYNSIRNNVSRIEGYTWDNYNNIRIQQDRLANGESMQDIINTFAYGDETYKNISAMYVSILGYAVDDATIRQQQAQLASGASFDSLRNNLMNR